MASIAYPATQTEGSALWPARDRIVRVCDVVLSATALLFLLPLMALIAVLVRVYSGEGPVIFAHTRIGKDGRRFQCFKFRSMVSDADVRLAHLLANDPELRKVWERDQKLRNDPRITPLGHFLRRSSLDELPQFWNVLVGDMSLVGPRPVVESEIYRYGRYLPAYIGVKPGITGLWQISGRNDVSYRRRVAMDVAFARSQSLKLYFKILVMTVPAVFLAQGSA